VHEVRKQVFKLTITAGNLHNLVKGLRAYPARRGPNTGWGRTRGQAAPCDWGRTRGQAAPCDWVLLNIAERRGFRSGSMKERPDPLVRAEQLLEVRLDQVLQGFLKGDRLAR